MYMTPKGCGGSGRDLIYLISQDVPAEAVKKHKNLRIIGLSV
jgi:hypothetical protein